MKALGVLCARGSSKRLPRKHLRPLLGLPLVAWMCRAAAASGLDRAVMTTEDSEIAAVARENGIEVPFTRAAHLAEDYAADYDIVADALDRCEAEAGARYDVVVMLQPTTPFTLPEDIDRCLARLRADPALACCFAARPVSEPPAWMFQAGADGRARRPFAAHVPEAHKQLLEPYWFPTGAVYAVRVAEFRRQRQVYAEPFAFSPMDRNRAVDIDEEADLVAAEAMGRQHNYIPVPLRKDR